jgi:hypothetical protein
MDQILAIAEERVRKKFTEMQNRALSDPPQWPE